MNKNQLKVYQNIYWKQLKFNFVIHFCNIFENLEIIYKIELLRIIFNWTITNNISFKMFSNELKFSGKKIYSNFHPKIFKWPVCMLIRIIINSRPRSSDPPGKATHPYPSAPACRRTLYGQQFFAFHKWMRGMKYVFKV